MAVPGVWYSAMAHGTASTGSTVCLRHCFKSPPWTLPSSFWIHCHAGWRFCGRRTSARIEVCLARWEQVLNKLQSQLHRRSPKHDSDTQQLLPVCLKCDASPRLDLTHLLCLSLARQRKLKGKKNRMCGSVCVFHFLRSALIFFSSYLSNRTTNSN